MRRSTSSALAIASLVVSAAALLGVGPLLYRLTPLNASLAAVLLAVAFACAIGRGVTSLAVGAGALGALAGAVLGGITAPLGGAVILAAAYADRLVRVRGRNPLASRALHLGLSLACGAAAAVVVHMYIAAPLPVRLVALSMAVVVALVPLLVPADDAVAHALESRASELPVAGNHVSRLLREAADLRRQVHDVTLPPPAQADATRSWRTLRELAEARARLQGAAARTRTTGESVTELVERRIEEHVTALARIYASASIESDYATALGLDAATLAAPPSAEEPKPPVIVTS